jgi:hypothetical protein
MARKRHEPHNGVGIHFARQTQQVARSWALMPPEVSKWKSVTMLNPLRMPALANPAKQL